MQLCLYQPEVVYGDPEANLHRFEECLSIQGSSLADALVVLPELFTTGYVFETREQLLPLAEAIPGGSTCNRLAALAKKYHCTLVAGLAETDGESLFNSVVVVSPEGFVGRYRKLSQTKIDRLYFERGGSQGSGQSNDHLLVFDWTVGEQSLRCGVVICFDLWFPQIAQAYARQKVDLLLHPANFGGPQTFSVAQGRAIETGLLIATCNRVGQESALGIEARYRGESQVVNAQGEVLAKTGGVADFLTLNLDLPSSAGARRILGVDWSDENQAVVDQLR